MPPKASAVGEGTDLRQHLIDAAERLIARRGTAGLTVREIAREARVATGALYNHVADKEELLALALRAHVRAVAAGLGPVPGPAGTGSVAGHLHDFVARAVALHAAILPAFAGMLPQPGVLARFTALSGPPDGDTWLRGQIADYLRAEQRLGRIASHARVDAAATMITGACHDLVLPHLFSGAPTGPVEASPGFATDLVTTVLEGIRLR
jgi:AcrR family transcriptional regulator